MDTVSLDMVRLLAAINGGQRRAKRGPAATGPATLARMAGTLDRLGIRYVANLDGSLVAMWERHSMRFALEGSSGSILVIQARPHDTVPLDWADRSYRAINEWNHSRRFLKACVADPDEDGRLPIYAELQVPLLAGVHDELLVDLFDRATAATRAFVDWLYDGALL